MKTLGRVLIILVAFMLVMSLAYVAVNGSGTTSTNTSTLENRGGEFTPGGVRPGFQDGVGGGVSWLFDMLKNIGIVAIIVALITLPKNWMQRNRQPVSAQR